MTDAMMSPGHFGSLIVFSDDWGRHPSSCQHLVRRMLDRYPVLWVNTIGMRAPRLDRQSMTRALEKVRQWTHAVFSPRSRSGDTQAEVSRSLRLRAEPAAEYPGLTVVNPTMWPWFSRHRDRRLNRWLLSRQLNPMIQHLPQPVVALTTLPITADLTDSLHVTRWVYYCVDDFSQWPGLDGDTLQSMDHDMIARANSLVAVSEPLQAMIASRGRSASLLTHGVDVDFWSSPPSLRHRSRSVSSVNTGHGRPPAPLIVFWGVIDRRMCSESLIRLSSELIEGTILLVGPQQDPDPAILALPNVRTMPPQPIDELPRIAAQADVLIMPYADLPVTRAMQPLKLKEYLATGKAVVVNRLPSTDPWCDCLDVAESPAEFSQLVRNRVYSGVSAAQATARCRLQQESWNSKAERLEHILKLDSPGGVFPPGEPRLISFRDAAESRCSDRPAGDSRIAPSPGFSSPSWQQKSSR